ncbi:MULTISPECIES: cytochrome c oxidase subunit 2A [Bacillaceae]|nr:cytochrome c oxidase subunit 2A [Bacillus sp. NTK034]MBN8203676.1 cytochrome c oxidase subunit 2A [Bacillus sp. NTK034]
METRKVGQSSLKEHNSLRGTFFSVTVVGLGIFVTYLIVYGLYMARL